MITIHNTTTGEIITRELNADELATFQRDQEENAILETQKTAKAAEKTALLAKLGITDDEAKLLLS
jgi:hypothetical protein